MIEALLPPNRTLSLIFSAICVLLFIAASIVGISDNPPGIAILALSAISFVLIFVHPWRIPKQFGQLAMTSLLGFIIFAVLSNIFEAIGSAARYASMIRGFFNGVGALFFILALIVCPAAIMVGIAGAIVTAFRTRNSQADSPEANL